MYLSTITFTALIAALAGQQALASPTASMSPATRDAKVRAIYEDVGKQLFDPSPSLAKRACDEAKYKACADPCSAFSTGIGGSGLAQGMCILSCAHIYHC